MLKNNYDDILQKILSAKCLMLNFFRTNYAKYLITNAFLLCF